METDRSFIFGINPVQELLRAAPTDVLEVMIAEGSARPALKQIHELARRAGLRVTYVKSDRLDRMANRQRHQGVLARVRGFAYTSFDTLLENLSTSADSQWILLLDGLTDPRNFGALLRTAEAVGIQNVLIPKDRAVGVTPVVAKASAGAVHHLKICRVTNLRNAITALKKRGFWIAALNANARENLYEGNYPERLGIVLGSEGAGVRPLIEKECDYLVSIPMIGKIASLNVAVAAGVFLYELLRRKLRIDKGRGKR